MFPSFGDKTEKIKSEQIKFDQKMKFYPPDFLDEVIALGLKPTTFTLQAKERLSFALDNSFQKRYRQQVT